MLKTSPQEARNNQIQVQRLGEAFEVVITKGSHFDIHVPNNLEYFRGRVWICTISLETLDHTVNSKECVP